MTEPFNLAHAGDEEATLLAEVTGLAYLDTRHVEAAAKADALASALLARIAECERDVRRYQLAETAEHERVATRYAKFIADAEARLDTYRDAIHTLALRTDFGTAKSRKTAWGTYGKRQKPARLAVSDPGVLLTWAVKAMPALVQTTIKQTVPLLGLTEHFKATGEVPPGCEYEPPRDEPFAKADLGD